MIPAGRQAISVSIWRCSSAALLPLVATRRWRPACCASLFSRSTICAKNGLPSSGTTTPITVRCALRRDEAATSRL